MKRMKWFTTALSVFVGTSVVAVAVWTLAASEDSPKSNARASGQAQQLSRSEKPADEVRSSAETSDSSAVDPPNAVEAKKSKRNQARPPVRRSAHPELDCQLD